MPEFAQRLSLPQPLNPPQPCLPDRRTDGRQPLGPGLAPPEGERSRPQEVLLAAVHSPLKRGPGPGLRGAKLRDAGQVVDLSGQAMGVCGRAPGAGPV
jgi:hypothetical protein